MPWDWGKSRAKKVQQEALQNECAELRYIATFRDLNAMPVAEIADLLARIQRAYDDLHFQILDRDDSPWRVVRFTVGLAVGATSLVGLTAAPLIAVVGVVGGWALSADELRGLVETHLEVSKDAGLLDDLKSALTRIEDVARLRRLI